MSLLAIIVVFFLMQHWQGIRTIQCDDWLVSWNQWLTRQLARFTLPVEVVTIFVIVLPALLAAVVCASIDDVFWGLPLLALLLVLLIYSLGRGDFNQQVQHYLQLWRSGDLEAAYSAVFGFSHGQILDKTDDPAVIHKHAVQAILYQGFERWFAVIFWFIVLGPFGALLYRISFVLANQQGIPDQQCNSMICRIIYFLEWLPVRLFGASLAVVGNFGSSVVVWRRLLGHDEVSTEERLMHYGLAALGEDVNLACQEASTESNDPQVQIIQGAAQIDALNALLNRTVVFSVVVVAIIGIFG